MEKETEMTAVTETETPYEIVDSRPLAVIAKAEYDIQITTAKKHPRSLKTFRAEALNMVTLTEAIASECGYALPRDGKVVEGPSSRFAEILASAWGNNRYAARVVAEDGEFITAQGIFHDLEKNVSVTYEVRRRIVNKFGRRFGLDMIGVTGAAACSIAMRNAILKGIPKAFWADLFAAARQVAMGDAKTLSTRRADALAHLLKFGASPEMICNTLGVARIEDIGLEQLAILRGFATAIRDGEATLETIFQVADKDGGKGVAGLKTAVMEKTNVKPAPEEATIPPGSITPQQFKKIERVCMANLKHGYDYYPEKLKSISAAEAEDVYTAMEDGKFEGFAFIVKHGK